MISDEDTCANIKLIADVVGGKGFYVMYNGCISYEVIYTGEHVIVTNIINGESITLYDVKRIVTTKTSCVLERSKQDNKYIYTYIANHIHTVFLDEKIDRYMSQLDYQTCDVVIGVGSAGTLYRFYNSGLIDEKSEVYKNYNKSIDVTYNDIQDGVLSFGKVVKCLGFATPCYYSEYIDVPSGIRIFNPSSVNFFHVDVESNTLSKVNTTTGESISKENISMKEFFTELMYDDHFEECDEVEWVGLRSV